MVELILVRHARSVVPTPGGPDEYHRPLTDEGHQQAAALVGPLRGARPAAIVSSPYPRAIQTVEPTARALGLPVRRRDDVREWDSGRPPTVDWRPAYERAWADQDDAVGTGESLTDLWMAMPMPAIYRLTFDGPHLHAATGPGLADCS